MPTYRMVLNVYTEAATPSEAAAEFLFGTEDAAVSFDIIEAKNAPVGKPRLLPAGFCWCGCGKEIGLGEFFAQGHNKIAEAAYTAVHHEGSVVRLLADTGFAPGCRETIREAALDRGGWELCPQECGYAGAQASVNAHVERHHRS